MLNGLLMVLVATATGARKKEEVYFIFWVCGRLSRLSVYQSILLGEDHADDQETLCFGPVYKPDGPRHGEAYVLKA